MKRSSRVRRTLSAVLATALAVTAVSLSGATPAQAAPPTARWYMLVNDSYEKCLSMNDTQSPSGAGTKRVYLAACNPGAPAQWWHFSTPYSGYSFKNYRNFENKVWELSSNAVTPPGGGEGTSGAYGAAESSAKGHQWEIIDFTVAHKVRVQSLLEGSMLSATHNNPFSTGIYRVYTAPPANSTNPPAAHLWRFWANPAGLPACTACGAL